MDRSAPVIKNQENKGENMKRSLTLVLITLVFVVLGCNLDKLTGKKDDVPTPVPESAANSNSESTPALDGSSPSSSPDSGASSSDVSMDKFNQIKLGMSYDDVKNIMGSPGDQTSMTKSGSYEAATYQWKGAKYARISVRFTKGELTYKSQSGLSTGSGTADLTQEKFNKINIGMSYDDVKNIIGSDGEMQSESQILKTTTASYRWKGPKYASIFASFKDGKLQNKTQSNLK